MPKHELQPLGTEEPQRIHIAYDGNLANRMMWNTSALAGYERASNLFQSITIQRGTGTFRDIAEAQGDTLIFKKIANPKELFSTRIKRYPGLEVQTDLREYHSDIIIHDQIITQKVLDKNDGVFSPEMFVQDVNRHIRKGIGTAMAKEKLAITDSVVKTDLFLLVAPMSLLGGLLLGKKMIENIVEDPSLFLLHFGNNWQSIGDVAGLGAAYLVAKMMGIQLAMEYKKTMQEYFEGRLGELIPFKHAIDAQRGNLYLARKGKTLVSLQDEKE